MFWLFKFKFSAFKIWQINWNIGEKVRVKIVFTCLPLQPFQHSHHLAWNRTMVLAHRCTSFQGYQSLEQFHMLMTAKDFHTGVLHCPPVKTISWWFEQRHNRACECVVLLRQTIIVSCVQTTDGPTTSSATLVDRVKNKFTVVDLIFSKSLNLYTVGYIHTRLPVQSQTRGL